MLSTLALVVFAAAGIAWIAATAMRDHRVAIEARERLLEPFAAIVGNARVAIGADGFPKLAGRLGDRTDVTIELIPDTLVMRRLPQLWLVVTLSERVRSTRPSFGALARPTGAEFYSQVLDLAQRVDSPLTLETGLMIRSDGGLADADIQGCCEALRHIFSDLQVKEIVATAKGVRIVRQAFEGERGAHLLLRQARFPAETLSPNLLRKSVAAADLLREALDGAAAEPEKLSA